MGIDFKKNGIKFGQFPGRVVGFFAKNSRWVLMFVGILFLGYFCYLWYTYIINPKWSDSQKQAYISTREGAISFSQKGFDAVISEIGKRKNEYNSKMDSVPDIFRLKQ